MLDERKDVRQIEDEGFRRWFTDSSFDLIVWYEDDSMKKTVGFQLCYDKQGTERALTWRAKGGYLHNRVDDGEVPYSNKMTPVLVQDGAFDNVNIREMFLKSAAALEPELTELVKAKLDQYPG